MKVKQLIFAAFACTVLVAGCSVDTKIVEKDFLKEEFVASPQLKDIAHSLMSNISSHKHQNFIYSSIKTSYFSSFMAKVNMIQHLFIDRSFSSLSKGNFDLAQIKATHSPTPFIWTKPSFLLVRTHQKKSELIFTSDFHDSYVHFSNRRKRLI